ncbi:MAG: hypothetical protein U0136_19520 [Bdellovibrionota bacterium]
MAHAQQVRTSSLHPSKKPVPTRRSYRRSGRSFARIQRLTMSSGEALLNDAFEGPLNLVDRIRLLPFHDSDPRYLKCRTFAERFIDDTSPHSQPVQIENIAETIAELCSLTSDGLRFDQGPPLGVLLGTTPFPHETVVPKDQLSVPLIIAALARDRRASAALLSGRLACVVMGTMFYREKDGSYSIVYAPLVHETNSLLEGVGQPLLSVDFSNRLQSSALLFGPRAAEWTTNRVTRSGAVKDWTYNPLRALSSFDGHAETASTNGFAHYEFDSAFNF